MKFSKLVVDKCNTYRLTPQDVFFALLVASGCSRWEAYGCVFNALGLKESTQTQRAGLLIREKPGLAKLIADLIQEKETAPTDAPSWRQYGGAKQKNPATNNRTPKSKTPDSPDTPPTVGGWDSSKSATDNLKDIMMQEFPYIHGKDKVDLSFKYAKLTGIDPDSTENTHYYLPLSCCNCELYRQKHPQK